LNDNAQTPLGQFVVYTVSPKNNTDIAHYNFNTHKPISLIFGTDIAE